MPGAMHSIARWIQYLEERSDQLLHVLTAEDVWRAKREGKLGIIFHFQNTDPVEDNLALLRVYHRLGVRLIQLTYNRKNRVGDGCEERTDCGLSRFGVQLIQEMNRLGIIVDLSHTGYRTTMEAIEIAGAPPIFSHSNCKAVCDSPRNLTDEQIRAVAARGGVIGINGFPSFVAKATRPTLEHFIAHIEHIAELVGPEHVGLALDYYEGMAGVATPERAQALYADHLASGIWTAESYPAPPWHYPEGLELPSGFPQLTEALVARGYKHDEIKKILGENFLRVFQQVWR
jgi:membrane dipeptidase